MEKILHALLRLNIIVFEKIITAKKLRYIKVIFKIHSDYIASPNLKSCGSRLKNSHADPKMD